jgi:hypothetical protein
MCRYFTVKVWWCRVCVLRQSCCRSNAYLVHRLFYRKLYLCCAVFGLFCYNALIHNGPKKKVKLVCKTKVRTRRKTWLGSIRHRYLWGIRTFGFNGHSPISNNLPPPVSPLNWGYTVSLSKGMSLLAPRFSLDTNELDKKQRLKHSCEQPYRSTFRMMITNVIRGEQ